MAKDLKIKRLSLEEAESKFCVGVFPDSDGSYQAELSDKEIKETYLENSIHIDEFIQVLEYQLKDAQKKLDGVEDKNSVEYLFLLGRYSTLEGIIRTFYNTGNIADLINKGERYDKQ